MAHPQSDDAHKLAYELSRVRSYGAQGTLLTGEWSDAIDETDYPLSPSEAFSRITHVEFVDAEDCAMVEMRKSDDAWSYERHLTDESGYYYSGDDQVGAVEDPYAYFVATLGQAGWHDIVLDGISQEQAVAMVRDAFVEHGREPQHDLCKVNGEELSSDGS
jgi:hypothetical protein